MRFPSSVVADSLEPVTGVANCHHHYLLSIYNHLNQFYSSAHYEAAFYLLSLMGGPWPTYPAKLDPLQPAIQHLMGK